MDPNETLRALRAAVAAYFNAAPGDIEAEYFCHDNDLDRIDQG